MSMFVNYTSIYCLKDQFIGTCISELGTSDVKFCIIQGSIREAKPIHTQKGFVTGI